MSLVSSVNSLNVNCLNVNYCSNISQIFKFKMQNNVQKIINWSAYNQKKYPKWKLIENVFQVFDDVTLK